MNNFLHRSALVSALIVTSLAIGLPITAFAAAPAAHAPSPAGEVAWLPAATDADVDRAFAQARAEGKPLLLYWGASWCPPCNQLKATLFNRQDFIERSRAFVPVHVDGDLPGAQKLGTRFRVRGYPTLILFNPAGAEITRLPGEADAPQVMQVLQLGMAGGRPVAAVLADAKAGKSLSANEWRMLAWYSWDTDDAQLVPEAERATELATLAMAVPPGEPQVATRLWLKALAESDDGKGVMADAALRERVMKVLADPAAARAQMDVLTNSPVEITRAITTKHAGGQRAAVLAAYNTALQRLEVDKTLSRADRMGALLGRIELARMDTADDAKSVKLPAPLVKDTREHVARDDREITDGYERQAVITTGAYALERAGLMRESDALLKANLAKSHSPYYLMSALAGNAKARGDKTEALRWYEEAYRTSQGPATRLQWGASYVSALVELSPQDASRIERAASALIADAATQPNAFYERSARSLQRAGTKLQTWNANGAHAETIKRLQAQLGPVCEKLPTADAQRSTCDALLKSTAPVG
ncbi:MAG: thioredoxin family protein [Burkholderiales bacterium]